MEIWKCLEILSKPNKAWFFNKDKELQAKLLALNRIAEIGSPSVISDLVPYLKDSSKQIRKGTIHTIKVLFEKINSKNAYYNALKYCPIVKSDINSYKRNFEASEFILLMKICSLNKNGYVREEAIKRLVESASEDVLPFIIFRLADWVPSVRQLVKESIKEFIAPKFQFALIDNLALFNWLQKVERTDLSEIYQEVIELLVRKNKQETIEKFNKVNDKERRLLANELSKAIQSSNEVNLFIKDKHFLIRMLALNHFDKLTTLQKESLLNDKSSRVRQSTLHYYKNDKDFKLILENYLADKSGSIRHFSRYYLKESNIDFRKVYIDNLIKEEQVIGSLLGLLDMEAKDCEQYIEPKLKSDKIKVVKTAFYVLSNLNSPQSYNFAKDNLFTNKIGLRNLIIEYFGKNRNEEVLEIARKHYDDASEEKKFSILKLYSYLSGYSILPDLLLGTIDENPSIRNQAILYVKKWKSEAISMFKKQSEEERNRAIKVYNFVNEVHNKKRYFDTNPVEGLDFYIG